MRKILQFLLVLGVIIIAFIVYSTYWQVQVRNDVNQAMKESTKTIQRTETFPPSISIEMAYENNNAVQVVINNRGQTNIASPVSVYAGLSRCEDAIVIAPGARATVSCSGTALSTGLIIRAVPPQGTEVSITCNCKPDGCNTSSDYCA